jgi:D-alanyl-D-alanine carboxypeptidase (penicillin-binding protein 5/6)
MAECDYVLPVGAPPLPNDLYFESWVIQDLDTGAVLAARDPHARQRPASLIKLLLALVVSRELDENTVITGTQDDANQDGTRVGIGSGGQYPVGLLLKVLLMVSGNDAAHALAMQLGGVPATIAKMNTLAGQLGARDTRAASPSGLDGPGMSTSAYDLSIVFRAALADPTIADVVRTTQLQFPGYGNRPGFMIHNDNELLRNYPGDLGGKTGYTDDAQQTYANAAANGGHRIALVMMRGTNHLAGRWQNARELMDYGFALENAHTAPVGRIALAAITASAPPPTADNLLQQLPTGATHGNAQVATVPASSLSAFGTIGAPLTIIAILGIALIVVLYLRRRQAKKAKAAATKANASAITVRTPLPNLGVTRAPTNGRSGELPMPTYAGTNGYTSGHWPTPVEQASSPSGAFARPAAQSAELPIPPSTSGAWQSPDWPSNAPEWPQ